jgi:hypothetical protein
MPKHSIRFFPFLTQIRGHADQRLQEYATALQTGGTWLEDLSVTHGPAPKNIE